MTVHMPARFRAGLATAATLLGGLALAATLAGPASAAPLPSHGGGLQPQFFTLTVSNGDAQGNAYGPVRGAFTDNETGPGVGVWDFAFPPGTVLVRHTQLDQPDINPLTCRGFGFTEGRWVLTGLTGRDRNAFGFGRFSAWEWIRVARDRRDGQCNPDRVLSDFVYVDGSGLAVNHHRIGA